MRIILSALALAAASPALAQTTNTNCQAIGSQIYCNSTTAPTYTPPAVTYDPNAFMRGWENSQRMFDAAEQARQRRALSQQERQRAAEATREQEMRQTVGRMIAAGRCKEALGAALSAGMLTIAQEVRGVCEPVP